MGSENNWLLADDVVFDCSRWRRQFESVLRRRGNNGVGKYGAMVALRWLQSLGLSPERWHSFWWPNGKRIRPDFFDPVARIAFEVKTGRIGVGARRISQLEGYLYAVRSGQTSLVVYLNVAFDGNVGVSELLRYELGKRHFPLIVLL